MTAKKKIISHQEELAALEKVDPNRIRYIEF